MYVTIMRQGLAEGQSLKKELGGCHEDQWERVAFYWVLGLGVLTGAWWTLFGMLTLGAMVSGKLGLAAPMLVLALVPNILWYAIKHDSRISAWLGCLEA